MMKFLKNFNENYYNSESISEYHKKVSEYTNEYCKPFIKLSKSQKQPLALWRGVSENYIKNNGKEITKLCYEINSPKNRNPTDTPLYLHNKLNEFFIKKFGWAVRNGVFCIPDKGSAGNYARISSDKQNSFDYPQEYFFIPIGDFEYCWSPKYKDLTVDIKVKKEINRKEELSELSDLKIKNIVSTYKSNDISDSTYLNYPKKRNASEISFNCDKYLLLSQRYFIGVNVDFWNW